MTIGWRVLFGVILEISWGKVQTYVDSHLCKNAAMMVLPKEFRPKTEAEMSNVVAALVQIDNTFGITPCQYRAMKGYGQKFKDLTEADSANKFDPSSVKLDAGKMQAIANMYAATGGQYFGGGGQRTNCGYEIGKAIGTPIRVAAELTAQAVNTGFIVMGEAISAAWDTSINELEHAVQVFDDLWYDTAGQWLYRTGEAIDDIWHDTIAESFSFFDGLAVGILGPSVEGRRRVVYDKDCDFIKTEIDSIENECSQYRYQRFVNLVPALRSAGHAYNNIMGNRSSLETMFSGEIASTNPGLREFFVEQRQALYGINGTCLNPRGTSLSQASTNLTLATFRLTEYLKRTMDSKWTNLYNTDKWISEFSESTSENFTNGILNIFNSSLDAYKTLRNDVYHKSATMTYDLRNILQRVVNSVNGAATDFNTLFDVTEENLNSEVDIMKTKLSKVEDRLEFVTEVLDMSPRGLGRFSDFLVNGIGVMLRSGQRDTELDSSYRIENVMKPSWNLLTEKFAEQSDKTVAFTQRDLDRYLVEFTRGLATVGTYSSHRDVARTASDLARQFDAASLDIEELISEMQGEQAIKMSSVQGAASRLASTVRAAVASASDTQLRRMKMYEELMQSNAQLVSNTQSKISELIASAAQAVNNEFSTGIDGITKSGASIREGHHELISALSSLVLRLRRAVANAAARAHAASSTTTGTVQTQATLQSASKDKLSDFWNQFIGITASDWQDMSEKIGGSIQSSSIKIARKETDLLGNVQTALAGSRDAMDEASNDARVNVLKGNVVLRGNEVAAGKASNGLTKNAGLLIEQVTNQAEMNGKRIKEISSQGVAGFDESRNSVADLVQQLSQLDFGQAAALSSGARHAIYKAKYDSQQDQDSVVARAANLGTDLSNRLSDILTSSPIQDQGIDTDEIDSALDEISESIGKIVTGFDLRLNATNQSYPMGLDGIVAARRSKAGSVIAESIVESNAISSEISAVIDSSVTGASSGMRRFTLPDTQEGDQSKSLEASAVISTGVDSIRSSVSDAIARIKKTRSDADSLSIRRDLVHPLVGLINLNETATSQLSNLTSILNAWVSSYSPRMPWFSDGGRTELNDQYTNGSFIKALSVSDFQSSGDALQAAGILAKTVADRFAQTRLMENRDFDPLSVDVDSFMSAGREVDSSRDLDRMSQSVLPTIENYKEASKRTGTMLDFLAKKHDADDQYSRGLYNAQSKVIVNLGSTTSRGSSALADDASDALYNVENAVINTAQTVEDGMRRFQSKFDRSVIGLSVDTESSNRNISDILGSDQNHLQVQLMVAKRALKELLIAWGRYESAERAKFRNMNETEAQFLLLEQNSLDSSYSKSAGSLFDSRARLQRINQDSYGSIEQFIISEAAFKDSLVNYRESLRSLNDSSQANEVQIKEMASNLIGNDAFMDQQSRLDVIGAVGRMEADMNETARLAIQSIR
jgi:hypothetical protein